MHLKVHTFRNEVRLCFGVRGDFVSASMRPISHVCSRIGLHCFIDCTRNVVAVLHFARSQDQLTFPAKAIK
jgi:hypothetical protein